MILDVGCGLKPGGDVNVDLFPCWREQRGRISEGCLSRDLRVEKIPNFVRASSLALPFRDAVFGEVVSNHVIEHVSCPTKMIQELLRVSGNYVVIRCPHHYGDTKKNKLHLHRFNVKSFEYFLNKLGVSYEVSYSNWRVFPHKFFPLFRLPIELTVKIWKA